MCLFSLIFHKVVPITQQSATFLSETCVMSHQSLSRQAKSKCESPTADIASVLFELL